MSPESNAAIRSELPRRVEAEIRQQGWFQPGDRVAVACSGGADSVALLRLLDGLKGPQGLRLSVVHLNHQLRGADSDEDEGFVRRLADSLGLECIAERKDVAARATSEKLNLEEAGREARRDFFTAVLQGGRADVVAVAHTLDDQAETVLARLLRGAGTRGLSGILPVVELAGGGRLVRPLLSFRREELRQYLHSIAQPWREDASNQSRDRLRNRLRLDALPVLERIAGPHIFGHLGRLAEQARDEEIFWAALVEEKFRAQAAPVARGFELPVTALAQAGPAVARRLIRRLCQAVRGDLRRVTQEHGESVLRLAEEGQSGKRVMLPGVLVERQFDRLTFSAATETAEQEAKPDTYCIEVAGPGLVPLPSGGALAFNLVGVEKLEKSYNCGQGAADASRASFPLVVRPWQAGDRYQPAGSAQEKKLKELFQQGRVPAQERRRTPVVLCRDEILWVPRFGVAAGYRISPGSRVALVMEERAES